MSTITPMTLQQLQDAIQVLYEGNPQTPDSGDDDYVARTALINQWINRWEMDQGVLWDELWTTYLGSFSAQNTIDTGGQYTCLPDFKFASGYIYLIDPANTNSITKVEIVDQEKAALLEASAMFAYFTGSPKTAYVLNLHGVPDSYNGWALKYNYYKFATKLEDDTDEPEMTDPYLIVFGTVANLFNNDGNDSAYVNHLQQAEERLGQMEVRNMMQPQYMNTAIDDDFPGFGT